MERLIGAAERAEDKSRFENIRPHGFAEFVGQPALKSNLDVFIRSAKERKAPLDHCLLYGPPGLGKTTHANIIANELKGNFKATSAPMFTKTGDLAAIFTTLEAGDVLFIDEIHRLPIAVEEVLYSVMEDFKLDLVIGEGPAARSVKIDVAPFTLVGATTRIGLLSNPLRDRFQIPLSFEFYDDSELCKIITRSAGILGIPVSDDGAKEIAKRSRGTPRIANRLLKRVRDFAIVEGKSDIDAAMADSALRKLQVDKIGLDALDTKYLKLIIENHSGGPVGLDTIAALLSEETDTIEDVIEPYLLQSGFIQKTPRGRVVSTKAYKHLGIDAKIGGLL